ncbi:pregnancy-associated plasma protein-A [Actinocorallia herbida]|uniref:Pregnancy-associated plasma protein-A n=1 Tax=Actinocorallia herbida TaxID=58109 RepID=A0A3N1D9J9_9ACTN|nr:zinc metalloprotease [Actinocorallia herbida]ROO90200.1 pregnancy-associated plasma protein-A [Actinocorallia herbida]
MKSVGKLVVLGLTVAATASVPQLASGTALAAPAPASAVECYGADLGPASDASSARVVNGSKVVEPHATVDPKVEAAIQFELTKQNLLSRSSDARAATKWIHIPVYFHVLHYGKQGKLSKKAINEQIAILDRAYKAGEGGHNLKINFFLKKVDYTNKKTWFKNALKYESAYKKKLHKGGKASLNLYTADLGNELLGFAHFPWEAKKAPKIDGAVVHYKSLPGGAFTDYNLGDTAVHEVGHWLGLYHTFGRDYPYQDGCAAGDRVSDTPDQGVPTGGCPADDAIPDTCPSEGLDPIHNYMDYGNDGCMTEFTKGQNDRVRALWKKYRTTKK